MASRFRISAPVAMALTTALLIQHSAAVRAEVTAEPSERGAVVKVDGELFAEYVSLFRHMPCVWPIHGPTGEPMTRSYPLGPRGQNEETDHSHHHSFWFTHEDVNGHNFWVEPREPGSAVIKQTSLEIPRPQGDEAVIETQNDWIADGKRVCSDKRTLAFGADQDQRWIDFTIVLQAPDHEVRFGDIKDGTFAVRVAGTMKPTAELGGRIVNSEGQVNTGSWGRVANWVDCWGPVAGETVGIALMSHPSNFRHPCRWHARTYGLITAAPFGEQPFPEPEPGVGGYTLAAGDDLTLRYRAIFHQGDAEAAGIADQYDEFARSQ